MSVDTLLVKDDVFSFFGRVIMRYDGPALDDQSMEISDLAPALLGFSDACKRAYALLNRDEDAEVSVRFAGSGEGCFVALILVLVHAAPHVASAVGYLGSVVNPIASVCTILNFLRDSRGGEPVSPPSRARAGKPVKVRMARPDGTTIEMEMTAEQCALLWDSTMRQAVEKIVDPLRKDGIEKLTLDSDKGEAVVVTKEEALAIKPPPAST